TEPVQPERMNLTKVNSGKMKARWQISTWLFASLFTVYNANFDFLPGDDATPNLYLPLAILEEGSLTFSPEDRPFMFVWRIQRPTTGAHREISIDGWLPQVKNWPGSIGYDLDELALRQERYYLVPSIQEGRYLSTFGVGAGFFALPVFAAASVFVDFTNQSAHFPWYLGKIAASSAVAGSAVFIFLTALRFCSWMAALLLAFAYGAGTCVWSISSQTLWQHGPNELFLAAACYFATKRAPTKRDWSLSGLALAFAVLCRPTSAVVVLTMGAWLLFKHRDAVPAFILGGMPIAVLLSLYNWQFLGSPLNFGQTERGHSVALEKTGSQELWSTPLFEGLSGLLFSPSRGLLVYSPFLLFAAFGILRIWRDREYTALRPFTVAFVCLLLF
ncbi:MAG: glycosyltransferase family 39 protein, partial [Verrucomicrobia bacterium]|nr:glycosyltransferase family 39 protein [Verrucomicrobiota bacterium]